MAKIGIKIDVLEELQAKLSLTDAQFATKIGVDYSFLWRIKTGRCKPGQHFIAKLLTIFPGLKFEDIFFLEETSHGIQAPTGTDCT